MSERVKYHTDLDVWQLARAIACAAYRATAIFPTREQFSLVDQIRRAASSVPANIAEGCGRGTTQELIRSLRIARGSLSELHSHLTLAADLEYLQIDAPIFEQIAAAHLKLNRMIGSLQRRA